MYKILFYTNDHSAKLKYVIKHMMDQLDSVHYLISSELHQDVDLIICYGLDKPLIKSLPTFTIPYTDYFSRFDKDRKPTIERVLSLRQAEFNFDLFAAIFFLLSRVEEYAKDDLDVHKRFKSSTNLLVKKGLHEYPVVDEWIIAFAHLINEASNHKLQINSKFKCLSTIDIDHVYAFKGKPLLHSIGSSLKDVLSLNFKRLRDRFQDFDPFDTYALMHDINSRYDLTPHYFILTSDKTKYDRSLNPAHPLFNNVVKSIAEYSKIGIHPSYYGSESLSSIQKELNILSSIIGSEIDTSRFHFLRMQLPDSFNYLESIGIKEDYSLGFADRIGFRSGTSKPYYWYDIHKDQVTDLLIMPFQIMDVTLNKYLQLDQKEAVMQCQLIIDRVKQVNGQFVLIWHNSSFYDHEGWAGWDKVYSEILAYATA